MEKHQRVAKWLLIFSGLLLIPFLYLVITFLTGISLAPISSVSTAQIVILILISFLPIIFGTLLYSKKYFILTSLVSSILVVITLTVIVFIMSIISDARQLQYRRERTHIWDSDLTIYRIVEDCGRSQSSDYTYGVGGTDLQNICYYQFAVKDTNASLCNKISDGTLRNECSVEVELK